MCVFVLCLCLCRTGGTLDVILQMYPEVGTSLSANFLTTFLFCFFFFCLTVERVAIGQEETAPTPAPFEWDPNDE